MYLSISTYARVKRRIAHVPSLIFWGEICCSVLLAVGYRYSIIVALCGMVAVREIRTTLTVFSRELQE